MENNPKKIKSLIITFVVVLLLLGGFSIFTKNNIFYAQKVSAVGIVPSGTPNDINHDADGNCRNGSTNPSNCNITYRTGSDVCKNGADNPYDNPPCTKFNGACKFGGTYPNCSANGFSTSYLPMASAGEALTAGMVETDANVSDARKKYLTYVSETESILKELNDISTKYNAIIAAAQKARDAATGTTPKTYCTFSELIQY